MPPDGTGASQTGPDHRAASGPESDQRTRNIGPSCRFRVRRSLSGASTTPRTGRQRNDERPPWRRADPNATSGPGISAAPVAFGRVNHTADRRTKERRAPTMATSGPESDARTRNIGPSCRFRVRLSFPGAPVAFWCINHAADRQTKERRAPPHGDERTRKRRADPEATSGPGSDERTRKRRADPEATSGPGISAAPVACGCACRFRVLVAFECRRTGAARHACAVFGSGFHI